MTANRGPWWAAQMERAVGYVGMTGLLFSADSTDEQIVAAFTAKYGHPPVIILHSGGGHMAGPISTSGATAPQDNPRRGQ